MKKATKRLMMVVAILLCLVLISTSVVSGIFAKFIIQKSATTSVGFTNFGMTVDLTVTGTTIKGTATKKGDTLIAEYNEIVVKPGDDFSSLFKITIKGEAKVQTKITVDVDLEYNTENFQIPSGNFSNVSGTCIPVGFKVAGSYAASTSTTTNKTTPYCALDAETAEQCIEEALAKSLGLTYSSENKNMTKTLNIKNGNTAAGKIEKTNIAVGFDWPATYSTTTNSDEIGTYLSLHNPNMKITTLSVTIKVEQV